MVRDLWLDWGVLFFFVHSFFTLTLVRNKPYVILKLEELLSLWWARYRWRIPDRVMGGARPGHKCRGYRVAMTRCFWGRTFDSAVL